MNVSTEIIVYVFESALFYLLHCTRFYMSVTPILLTNIKLVQKFFWMEHTSLLDHNISYNYFFVFRSCSNIRDLVAVL